MSGLAVPHVVKAHLVRLANEVRPTLTGDFAEVQAIIDGAEIVHAVWTDLHEADGVGILLIKGHHRLSEIATGNRAASASLAAIPCSSAEQAEALRQVAGERDRRQ